jgi:maltooligosyltrehalose trehalohydrolase
MIFSVWAPFARSVDLVLSDERLAMRRQSDDHWSIELDAGRARAGYRYSIDGGEPLPDPRSRWQPEGVHGASRLVDMQHWHRDAAPRFRPCPLAKAVIYELHIGTFTSEGTYAAASGKLPYLADLGVSHVELLPVATFPMTA